MKEKQQPLAEQLGSIRRLIAEDRLDEVLKYLCELLRHSPLLDEAIQHSGRHAAIRKQIRWGTVSHAEAALTENQIRMALLEFVQEIEDSTAKTSPHPKAQALREELTQAISIVNSKNVVIGSNIRAGGNVQIGDTYTNVLHISKASIQEVNGDALIVQIGDQIREIRNEFGALKALLQQSHVQQVQYADKIYNIGHIDEANFGVVTSKRIFNGVLARELIGLIQDKPKVKAFLKLMPAEDQEKWECMSSHLKDAQALIEEHFVWVVSWELRRMFAIASDKGTSMEVKVEKYIERCFSVYRRALQLANYLFLSVLWDAKKNDKAIGTNQSPLRVFFSHRMMKLAELRGLLRTLVEIFQANDLALPLTDMSAEQIALYTEPDSAFNRAGASLEALQALEEGASQYGLGYCHTAEIALAAILKAFPFFTTHQLVTMKRVEYEEVRHSQARYIKDFSILEKTEANRRILKYDNQPALTYAVLYRNQDKSVNLFPFLLDFNALTNEGEFQILVYESRDGDSGLRYCSINKEKDRIIEFRGAEANQSEIKSEEQKEEEQKTIRIDLAIKQFEDAMNTLLDQDEHFQPHSHTMPDDLDNI